MSKAEDPNHNRPLSAKSLHLLHVLATTESPVSLEAAKFLLDSAQCSANDQEPEGGLSPLHVAAAWDNLPMCQLLVHYGADVRLADAEERTALEMSKGQSRNFLRALNKRGRRRDRRKIFKWLRALFEPHRRRARSPSLPRSASAGCLREAPARPSLEEEIEEYLRNASNYNARLSGSRFSGLHFPPVSAEEAIQLVRRVRESGVSSSGTFRTAPGSREASFHTAPRTVGRSTDVSAEFATPAASPDRTLPSAPPLTPNVTFRSSRVRPPLPPAVGARSASLCRALEPKDPPAALPPIGESLITEDETADEAEDPDLLELEQKAAVLRLDELKERLAHHGHPPGPAFGPSTRAAHCRLLAKLELRALRGVEYEMQRCRLGLKYSIALERLIRAVERGERSDIGAAEEAVVQQEFRENPASEEISFFCYLLLDISDLLPACSFREFVDAIFYVGKGKRARPLQHFHDALKHKAVPKGEPSRKIERILGLWARKMGVVSLHLFNNIHSTEAFIREGAMIEALGLENLTNLKRGEFKGASKLWPKQRLAEYGALLLHKAYVIFLHERCRPIFEEDVAGSKAF
ncbi:Ankyrin repeat and LEM domain-containing protein 1 [Aphelenchoides fujianensis]|nr:Ankyrin repeat and LEM domain-containing protein 1 [Aphelenchoides fujianensis]